MNERRYLLFSLILLLLTASCAGLTGSPLPTLIPEGNLPTVIELTAQALVDTGLVTPPPTATLDPDVPTITPQTTDLPQATPTTQVSPTPTLNFVVGTLEPISVPDILPQAEIQIISPGRLSRVLSPFRLHLYLVPPRNDRGDDLLYQVSLFGENGQLISRDNILRDPEEGSDSHLLLDVDFKLSKAAEAARLEISAVDPYGRISALASTDIVLLSGGEQEIKTILDLFADLIIDQPVSSTLIQGDLLTVRGLTRIAPDDKLLVECLTRDGSQVGSAVLEVSEEDLGNGYRAFEGEIPFQVGSSSWVRVQMIAQDGQFSGIQHLTSVEVLVSP
jgi:hypothetical protein